MTGAVIMPNYTKRISERFETTDACRVCTVLESLDGAFSDISQHGAKINVVNGFRKDDKISLDIDGDVIWGEVTWAEHDRIGVKFLMPITGGRFMKVLSDARQRSVFAHGARTSGSAPARVGFGKRAA